MSLLDKLESFDTASDDVGQRIREDVIGQKVLRVVFDATTVLVYLENNYVLCIGRPEGIGVATSDQIEQLGPSRVM